MTGKPARWPAKHVREGKCLQFAALLRSLLNDIDLLQVASGKPDTHLGVSAVGPGKIGINRRRTGAGWDG